MPHSWNEKQTTPILHLFDTTVFLAHFFVVVHGVQRRKPWITYAVIKDQFSVVAENVERLVHVASPILAVASDASTHAALGVKLGARRSGIHRAAAAAEQNAGNAAGIHDSGIEWERVINRVAT